MWKCSQDHQKLATSRASPNDACRFNYFKNILLDSFTINTSVTVSVLAQKNFKIYVDHEIGSQSHNQIQFFGPSQQCIVHVSMVQETNYK